MTLLLKTLSFVAAFAAGGAFAAEPDPHAHHDPAAASAEVLKPEAKSAAPEACPMMGAKMKVRPGGPMKKKKQGGQGGGSGVTGGKMMDGGAMPCMPSPKVVPADPHAGHDKGAK